MAFTRTWNTSYEATPADGDTALAGANRIRDLKLDIRERLEIDHVYGGASDTDSGKHKRAVLLEQGAKPTLIANEGAIYTKDISGVTELFYENSGAVETQLTSGGNAAAFPAGTRILFQQTSAPTGWTKETNATYNDAALRIVTGSASTGGANEFSTVMAQSAVGGYALQIADIPSHTHADVAARNFITTGTALFIGSGSPHTAADFNTLNTGATGGGGSHAHSITMNIKYADVIIATKN